MCFSADARRSDRVRTYGAMAARGNVLPLLLGVLVSTAGLGVSLPARAQDEPATRPPTPPSRGNLIPSSGDPTQAAPPSGPPAQPDPAAPDSAAPVVTVDPAAD